MKTDVRDAGVLAGLQPLEVASYLYATGWSRISAEPGRISTWTYKDDAEILLPLRRDFRDFAVRMGEVVGTLAEIESRGQLEILDDLFAHREDVIRIGLQDEGAEDGSLEIEDHVEASRRARDVMMAAACAAVRPRAVHPNRRPQSALDYMRSVRVGQSERGSYVLRLLSPVPPTVQIPSLFPDSSTPEPFPRRVTSTLAKALAAAAAAAEQAASGMDVGMDSLISRGVSANLCEAVAALAGEAAKSVRFSFKWSATRPAPAALPRSVYVSYETAAVLAEVSRLLREHEPVEEFDVLGPVTNLSRGENEPAGRVTVVSVIDGRPRQVNMVLAAAEYDLAARAHTDRIPIACTGLLEKEGGKYWIRNPAGLIIETGGDEEAVTEEA